MVICFLLVMILLLAGADFVLISHSHLVFEKAQTYKKVHRQGTSDMVLC